MQVYDRNFYYQANNHNQPVQPIAATGAAPADSHVRYKIKNRDVYDFMLFLEGKNKVNENMN
jgi:hypothetical protein